MFVIDKIFNLKIDTKNKNITTVTGLKQFDNNSVLNITLLQNSLALDLSNCTIRINFLREDDKVLLYMANIVNAPEGKVSIKLSPEVLEKSGLVKADISVFDSNLLKITSATFNLRVEKSIFNDTYFSEKDLDLMQQEYAREKERQKAESARIENELERITKEGQRNSNENTRISNEEARKKAEDTRVAEWNDVKKDANNIKNTLETTIDTANKSNSNLKNNIDTADKLKQELTPQNYVTNAKYNEFEKKTNTQYEDCVKQLKENATKTIARETNVISLDNSVDGIANIEIGGNTLYKRNNTYTDKWEDGCTLESVGEDKNEIVVKSIGKNLFNGVYEKKYTSYGGSDPIDALNETRTAFVKIQPDKTYYIKKHTASNRFILGLYNSTNVESNSLVPLKNLGDNTLEGSITNTVNAKYLSIYVSNANEEPKMQVEEGTTATTYEDYKEDKVTINLKEPLRGLTDSVRDTINADGTVTRRVGKVVLNENSLFFMRESTDGGWKQFEDSLIFEDDGFEQRYKLKHFSSILSNMSVKEMVNNNVEGIAYNAGTGWSYFAIRIKKSKLSTPDINGFKKYLKENPLTVYYELKEPIIESIGQPLTLQSFTNGILQVDTEITPYLTVKYPSNLNSRISTVESATSYVKNNLGGAWQTLLILADKELKMKSISKLTTTDDVSKKINEIIGVW